MGKVPRKIKLTEGLEAYSRIESARGDMQYYVVAGAEFCQRFRFEFAERPLRGLVAFELRLRFHVVVVFAGLDEVHRRAGLGE